MITVHFGNPAPLDAGRPYPGPQITTALLPTSYTDAELFRTVTHRDGLWPAHSSASAPSWVESDHPELADVLAAHYGCPIGRPAEDPISNGAN